MKKHLLVAAILSVIAVAQAQNTIIFTATLDGPSEAPPNNSPGIGEATVTYDPVVHTLRVQASFSGLLGDTTVAHIHAPTALPLEGTASPATPTPTFPGFPTGVTSGTYDQTFDLTLESSYSAAFLNAIGGSTEAAEAALVTHLQEGKAYLNIHSSSFPGGEIRGFLIPNLTIGDCDTGVPDLILEDGRTLSDLINTAATGAKNHGQFVSAVAKLKNAWRKAGLITSEQAEAIQSCAARSR